MKKLQLLLLTLLIPFLGYTQNSWINIQLLTDNYPTETSWQITPTNGTPIIIGQDPAVGINELYDTTIAVQGFFIASIFDSYGDGLGASQWNGTDGWFLIQNDCQDTIMYVAGDFGVSYIDHFNSIFLSLRKDVISNYKVSISLNHPDSFLLEKFRGTREFNYKNSIFSQYHNKLKSLVKSIICSYSSELRFFFYFKHQNKFPFFAESIPISESKSKKSKTKLGTYKTEDFSPQKGSESWKGCLPHFNSTVTQIPLYSLDESDKHDLRDWFFNRSKTYQKEVVGENRFRIMESGDYVHSQIFDFSKTSITIANL